MGEALEELANEAARAVTEPRRFHENEDGRQQELSARVATARLVLGGGASSPEELEDALLGYFSGGYPRGNCRGREDAVRTIWEATERARERELETLHEAAET